MHELSICQSLVAIVAGHAGDRIVDTVHLDVGHLRQVVPETLAYSWDVVVAGTALEGSRLAVAHIPAVIACRACGASTTLTAPVFRCSCGSTDVTVVSGQELLVRSLDLVPRTAPSPTAES